MSRLADLAYLVAFILSSPILLWRLISTGKIRTDWAGRFGAAPESSPPEIPRLLVHAVSVGEINSVRHLVDRLAERGERMEVVVASTTDTGIARARAQFGDEHRVVRYPLDFSFSVDRFLDRVQPTAVALVELEVWPNFLSACARRGIPVSIINGRLSIRSSRRYAPIRPLIRRSFSRLAFAAVQNEEYAPRFSALGVAPERVHVTGSMKWDTAHIADDIPGAAEIAESMGVDRSRPLVVAGSTAPTEHELLAAAVPDDVQLMCAPRRPEWFDQAAGVLSGCARRSRGDRGSDTGRFLLDTIGELRMAYALADIVVVGRSFCPLHGSDMIEPVGLGKPTIVGPFVSDFQFAVDALRAGDGLVQTDRDGLRGTIADLLADPDRRTQLAENGREVIRAHCGATDRNIELLRSVLV